MNSVQLIGNIVRDLEIKVSQTGTKSLRFSVAVQSSRKDSSNNYQTDFINCVAFNNQAEMIAKWFRKGSKIGINGTIVTGSYDKDGQRVYTTDVWVSQVTFCERRQDSQTEQPTTKPNKQDDYFANFEQTIPNDVLPF